jgi:alkylated DNA repair dioxygenase AlkB
LPALAEIRCRLEDAIGCRFNSVLLNLYRDGRDGMGWHSDDEPELGREPTIASLSFGATRRFLLRHRERRDLPTLELRPANGSLILMSGVTQRYWKHQVPKTARPTGPRLNLTFRSIAIPGDFARQTVRPALDPRDVSREYS